MNAVFGNREVIRFQALDWTAFSVENNRIHQHHASGDVQYQPRIFRGRRWLLRGGKRTGENHQHTNLHCESLHRGRTFNPLAGYCGKWGLGLSF